MNICCLLKSQLTPKYPFLKDTLYLFHTFDSPTIDFQTSSISTNSVQTFLPYVGRQNVFSLIYLTSV